MKMALCVCGYNNPNYLYITLDSLFRVRKIENYPIYVFIDNNGIEADNILYRRIFQLYPIQKGHIYDSHIGDVDNTFFSMDYCFKQGYDKVVYLEHDQHFMPDILEYYESLDKTIWRKCTSINIGRKTEIEYFNWFDMMGWAIDSNEFYQLWEWIKLKKYVGEMDIRTNKPMPETEAMDGQIFMYWMMNNLLMHYSLTKDHIGSFGVTGVHAGNNELSKQYDAMFFNGNPKQWLFNVASILYKGDYPKELETHLFTRYSPLYLELPNTNHYFDDVTFEG